LLGPSESVREIVITALVRLVPASGRAKCSGVLRGRDHAAKIRWIDDYPGFLGDKVTFAENKGKGQKGPEQTLPATENVKVIKGKFNRETKTFEAGEPVVDGLKNTMFSNIGEKGVRATIITDDSKKITEVRLIGKGGKAKQ
jgi:hypothetical protein